MDELWRMDTFVEVAQVVAAWMMVPKHVEQEVRAGQVVP